MKRIVDSEAQSGLNITGKAIRRARIKAKLSQKELSIRLETMAIYICRGSVSRIENGSRIVTDIELKAICDVLRIPVQQLFSDTSDTD